MNKPIELKPIETNDIVFYTNNEERIRITKDGEFYINKSKVKTTNKTDIYNGFESFLLNYLDYRGKYLELKEEIKQLKGVKQ